MRAELRSSVVFRRTAVMWLLTFLYGVVMFNAALGDYFYWAPLIIWLYLVLCSSFQEYCNSEDITIVQLEQQLHAIEQRLDSIETKLDSLLGGC